jgi:galactokinase
LRESRDEAVESFCREVTNSYHAQTGVEARLYPTEPAAGTGLI